jgi:PBSX family phage terminase large subunit
MDENASFYGISDKQRDYILNSDARLNIAVGSVRSGKTFAGNIRITRAMREAKPGDGMMLGVSRESLQRNVVKPLCDWLCIPAPTSKAPSMNLWGRHVYLVGAPDERAQDKITGSTLAWALIDELTLMPYGLFKMLQSRLSVAGAQLFATTNPDSPFHWVKRELIDNPELSIKVWNFNLDDNPALDPEFVENIKKEYTGIWYQRYIEGKWVLAEGAIYPFFDPDIHVINHPPTYAKEYIVGVDYGTTNPCVFVLIGIDRTQFPNIWCEKEYVYDSAQTSRQKSDSEYVDDLASFINGYNVKAIYVDPSATSFKVECRKQGISQIFDAENDVLNGIRYQYKLMLNGTYKVCKNCTRTIEEYGNYLWNKKAAENGKEEPLKRHDHTKDAERYALFTHLFDKDGQRMTANDIDRNYNKAMGFEPDVPYMFRQPMQYGR